MMDLEKPNILQGRQNRGAGGAAAPPLFREIHLFILKFDPKNIKSQIIYCVPPPQYLRRPLSFREVVTPLL